jgi:D-arginine utilization repressor
VTVNLYIPLCQALVKLMAPLVEVVIHNIESNTIVFIDGNLSSRKVGDPSLLDRAAEDIEQVVYSKISFDGKPIRSISIPLINNEKKPKFLVCINFDTSVFAQIKDLVSNVFNHSIEEQPQALFKDDWQERLHTGVHKILKRYSWKLDYMNNKQKKYLVEELFRQGAFNQKNAVDYVAKILRMGRATIFNYLRGWRNYDH